MKKTNVKKQKVLVFGTFDGIHDGHRYFLGEAKKFGDYLVVAVARDRVVKMLKGRAPNFPISDRISALKKECIADKIVAGDLNLNTWSVIIKEKPDIICIGYDQKELKTSLEKVLINFKQSIKICSVSDYQGNRLHSSLLGRKK